MSLSRSYAAALGKTVEQMAEERKKPGAFLPYIYALIGNIIIGWMLAGLLGHLGAGQVTFRNGIISVAFIWFGFILTTMVVNFSFSGRDRRLLAIDAGNWLIVLLVIGAVIGGIGVESALGTAFVRRGVSVGIVAPSLVRSRCVVA